MSTSRQEFRAMCRSLLGDPEAQYFRDIDINQWIADAIGEYNQHFSREEGVAIALLDGHHIYSLAPYFATIKDVLRVEYPDGEDPPQYLERRAYDDPRGFWDGLFYDLRGMGIGGRPGDLMLAPSTTSGEYMRVWYLADHTYPDADGDSLTIPDRDLNLLASFVRWRAIVSLESREMANPNLSTIVLSMLGTNARGAKREFDSMLAGRLERVSGAVISWGEPRNAPHSWDLPGSWRP